jgi:hypothetical protein
MNSPGAAPAIRVADASRVLVAVFHRDELFLCIQTQIPLRPAWKVRGGAVTDAQQRPGFQTPSPSLQTTALPGQ